MLCKGRQVTLYGCLQVYNMRIIQIQLYVLMCCQVAETLDQLTDLGQNVTINCDLDANEVYWILLKQSDYHTVILRSFSKATHYFNKTFKNKYSIQSKHRLVIHNVTVDELGVYYCMNTDTPPKLSNSTGLHIIEPTQLISKFSTTQCTNHTNIMEKNVTNTTETSCTQWTTFTLISGLLNGVLIITVIGLLKVCVVENGSWKKCGNSSGQLHNTDLQQTQVIEEHQDPNQLQYVAVDFSKLRKNFRPSQESSTYAALNVPNT